MRDPTFDDAQLALTLYDLRRESELRKARALIGDLVSEADWPEIEALMQYDHEENAHWRQATSYWEMAASFVNRGIFHPDVYLDTCGEGLFTFACLRPFLARIREKGSPRFLMQTERVVNEHPACRERVEAVEKLAVGWRAEAAKARAERASKKERKEKEREKGKDKKKKHK